MTEKLTVLEILPKEYVIKQNEGARFFILGKDSIILSADTMILLISFFVKHGFISPKVLEGILEDVRS